VHTCRLTAVSVASSVAARLSQLSTAEPVVCVVTCNVYCCSLVTALTATLCYCGHVYNTKMFHSCCYCAAAAAPMLIFYAALRLAHIPHTSTTYIHVRTQLPLVALPTGATAAACGNSSCSLAQCEQSSVVVCNVLQQLLSFVYQQCEPFKACYNYSVFLLIFDLQKLVSSDHFQLFLQQSQ
jgi:hypothetical protein